MICVGIDVSKGKSTVCILKPGGEVLASPFEIIHSIESILSLVERINSYEEETRVVLEATGHYHLPVVSLLVEKGIFVCPVNALRDPCPARTARPPEGGQTSYISSH